MEQTNKTQALQSSVGKKSNKAFMILSALGILFVVDEHLGRPINFLYDIFPYDSFFMPLFMFISGYFFNVKHCAKVQSFFSFSWIKFKKSLFPYVCWIAFYGVVTALLRAFGVINFGKVSLFGLLRRILSMGTSFGYNDPSWFVPALFCVCVFYCFMRTALRKIWNDVALLVFFVLLGALSVYLANTSFNVDYHYYVLKIMFFTQFYHLGYFFKAHIEKCFDKIPALWVCLAAVGVNVVLLCIYGYDIRFPWCARMGGFFTDNIFLPLITSITGIAFWLKVSKLLAPMLGDNKLVNFISDNTFFIMTHHLTANALFTGMLLILKKCGISVFDAVSMAQFKASAWYVFQSVKWCNVLGFFFTVAATLIALQIHLRLKRLATKVIPKKQDI